MDCGCQSPPREYLTLAGWATQPGPARLSAIPPLMASPFPPTDHRISLEAVVDLTARYRESGQPSRWKTFGFHRLAFERILRQPGCAGIRIYPAQHDDGRPTVVLVGVDEKGSDMTGGAIAQDPVDCPPDCDLDSVLHGKG